MNHSVKSGKFCGYPNKPFDHNKNQAAQRNSDFNEQNTCCFVTLGAFARRMQFHFPGASDAAKNTPAGILDFCKICQEYTDTLGLRTASRENFII